MSYAANFLKAHGQICTIERDVPITSRVSIKRTTKSTNNVGNREALWEGLILADAGLQSGEILTIGADKYLIQSVNHDPASGEDVFFAAKTNVVLTHKRYVETVDENGNIVQEWQTLHSNVYSYCDVDFYRLLQYDIGLFDPTKYIFQVSKSLGVAKLDRFVLNDVNYQVANIDDIVLTGIARIQLESDTRP
jgi:hypothetical protein